MQDFSAEYQQPNSPEYYCLTKQDQMAFFSGCRDVKTNQQNYTTLTEWSEKTHDCQLIYKEYGKIKCSFMIPQHSDKLGCERSYWIGRGTLSGEGLTVFLSKIKEEEEKKEEELCTF